MKKKDTHKFELTTEQAEWLSEKILRAFLESDIAEPDGVNLARAVVMELAPKTKPQVVQLKRKVENV